jgi:sugar-specific transcriptional regulator TrmB
MSTLKDTLVKAGLPEHQAEVYVILASGGEMLVPQILAKTELSRATVYDALPELLVRGLLEYRKEGREAYYKPVHPNKLFDLLEQKKRDTALLEDEMKTTIKTLEGSFSLAQNRAGVRFFEGLDGLQVALNESLDAKDTIYTFADSKTVDAYLAQIDKEYISKRLKKQIKKKLILTDSEESRKYVASMNTEFTEAKLIDPAKYPFTVAVEVYNNDVSFLSVKDGHVVSFVVTHEEVARFHRSLFEFLWDRL